MYIYIYIYICVYIYIYIYSRLIEAAHVAGPPQSQESIDQYIDMNNIINR